MKKLLTTLVLSSLLLVTVIAPAYAETPAEIRTKQASKAAEAREKALDKRTETKNKIEDKRTELASKASEKRENLASKAAEKRNELRKKFATRIKELMLRIAKRMQVAVDRFSKLIERAEARRDKIKEHKKDVTKINAWITKAKQNRDAAHTAVNNAKAAIEAINPDSEDAKTQTENARVKIKEARQALVTMWTTMKQVVVELKTQDIPPTATDSATPATGSATTE